MRYLRYLFLAMIGLVLITIALANRGDVTLRLLPDELSGLIPLPYSVTLPLFMAVFVGVFFGLLIGFVWEYLREYRMRADLSRKDRELHRLERQIRALREKTGEGQDEVLALLDGR